MPSAPKKSSSSSSKKKSLTLSQEEQVLLISQRRDVIEKRIQRLQSKIIKDQALLEKYTQPSTECSSGSDLHSLSESP
jgi:hypothetical protein